MNQPNQNNSPDGSGDVPLKRKRGRPRKYPKPHVEENAYTPNNRNINQNRFSGNNAQVPPGFERFNGNQPRQRDVENNTDYAMVGQVVSGVVEAVFDAGYLVSVRVGNSDTTVSGLVFKPGRYVPISAENDVAPDVPMIRRHEVPFPATNSQVKNRHPKQKKEQHVNIHRNETHTVNGSPSISQAPGGAVCSSNLITSQGRNVPSLEEQTNPLARGNVVPLVLPPDNLSNVEPVNNQSSQVITQASLGSVSSVTKEISANGNQAPSSQTQTGQNMLPRGMQNEAGTHHHSSDNVMHEAEVRSMKLPSMPSKPVTEVFKRIQVPSESIDTETGNKKSGDKRLDKDSSSRQEDKVNYIDQALLIKPLQAVQAGPQEHPPSAIKPLETNKTGRMTELLQVLQDNIMVNQEPKAEEVGSGQKLDDIRNFETELEDGEDGETGQSTKRARA